MGFKFELGGTLKEVISGFQGVCMGRSEYITGCNQYSIAPRELDQTGKIKDWCHFDENRLVKVESEERVILNDDETPEVKGFDGTHSKRY